MVSQRPAVLAPFFLSIAAIAAGCSGQPQASNVLPNAAAVRNAASTTAEIPSVARRVRGAGKGYWHVRRGRVVDMTGTAVRIAGVNWFGLETPDNTVDGLWSRNYQNMMNQMVSLGFNTIRLPYSNQLLDSPAVPSNGLIDYALNPDLKGLTGPQIMDKIVAYASKVGLRVLLDRHRPDNGSQSALWYTSRYPESVWIADWVNLAKHYAGNSAVIGADLHNEPHDPACWSCGVAADDWHLAAERAGNAILAANPHWLIVVEGVQSYDNDYYWWGGNLEGAQSAPVVLSAPSQLVYSAHDYPSSVSGQPWFSAPNYPSNLPGVWDAHWGYLIKDGIAPVLLGEFGSELATTSDDQWFSSIVSYLKTTGAGWTFWSWNPNSGDTGGILNNDWTTVNQTKVSALQTMMAPLSTFPTPIPTAQPTSTPTAQPTSPPTATPTTAPPPVRTACAVTYAVTSDWGSGFVVNLTITNTGSAPVNGWNLVWAFAGNQQIGNLWNGVVAQSGRNVTVANASYDASIPAGASVYPGFQAAYSGSNARPAGFTLNGVACKAN
jgi:endoglucanase